MPRARKLPHWATLAAALRFRFHSRPVEDGLVEVRLIAEGGEALTPLELEVPVERVTWIPRDFIESMGGEAPYDRFEVRWPLASNAESTRVLAWNTAQDEIAEERGADALAFAIPGPIEWHEIDESGETTVQTYAGAEHSAVTTFHAWEGGVWCRIGTLTLRFRASNLGYLSKAGASETGSVAFENCTLDELHSALEARNSVLGVAVEKEKTLSSMRAPRPRLERREDDFPLHTGEEWTAFIQSAADGKSGRNFAGNEQSGVLRHQRAGATFWTETVLLDEERSAGHGIELLHRAAADLDIDDGLAWLYISHLLAPPAPLAHGTYAGGWIDLDDIARKTMGGYARNPKEAQERRAKVWRAIRYGARANIGGKRSVPYFDKTSGQEIDTEIYVAPWQIVSRQKVAQLPLFGGEEEPPVRVELVASREWTALTTEASTAQYLPFGEILGALPANQPGGAWARVLGLSYVNWCRRRIAPALEGLELPTRRELLDAFPSKVAPYRDILEGPNPLRALGYWQAAEMLLVEQGIIETDTRLYEPAARKGWQSVWLSERPTWKPGPLLRPVLEKLNARRFPPKTRNLKLSSGGDKTRLKRRRRDLPAPE